MSSLDEFYSLDQPEVLLFVFYPRKDHWPGPPDSTDHIIPVEEDVSIVCRFYPHGKTSPTIIYFHGNGEVVSDHDYVAPYYNELGINLFVPDYRGYGASGGTPTFRSMTRDTHTILNTFKNILNEGDYSGNLFVMGRSLGSISAVELAFHHQDQFKGVILESGIASITNLMRHMGTYEAFSNPPAPDFPNLAKIKSITLPTLILHGERDTMIPVSEAKTMYKHSAAKDKRLVLIQSDHNDIMLLGMEEYFSSIRELVSC